MYLTPRQKKLMLLLSSHSAVVTGKLLCEQLSVSLRTLQNEIKAINQSAGIRVICSTNRGYLLDRTAYLETDLSNQKVPEQENDQETLLKKLLLDGGTYPFTELAESLYMSLSTLNRKLGQIQKKIEPDGLTVKRENGSVFIQGTELNKRKMIRKLIYEEASPFFLNSLNRIENLASYFEGINVVTIRNIILTTIEKYGYYVEECYITNLVMNILITLSRLKKSHSLETYDGQLPKDSPEYRIAQDICAQISSLTGITFRDKDIQFMAMLMLGQIKPNQRNGRTVNFRDVFSRDFIDQVENIVVRTFRSYLLPVKPEETFLNNFIFHTDALIKRARNHQCVNNPIAGNIKANCPFVYDVAVYLAKLIEDEFKIRISDEEIGFISIHIGFAIESFTEVLDKIRVLLVCSQYHQIARNLVEHLKRDYSDSIEIVSVISDDSQYTSERNENLIISTAPLHVIAKKVVVISPFFTVNDKAKLDKAILECRSELSVKNEQSLLLSYFHKDLFFHDLTFRNKEEVIRFLGNKLEAFGYAKTGFVDSVLKRESMSSTSFFDTFAIPHAIELEAQKTMFCILVNRDGIPWDGSLIKCVFMIAVNKNERKSFSKIYSGIIQILCDKERVNQLVSAQNLEELIAYFSCS